MQEILSATLPVPGIARLVLSYAVEPIEWWKFIPDPDERLQFLTSQGFTVALVNPVLMRQPESKWRLNSSEALFGHTDVTFEFGDWKCSAGPPVTNWFKKKPGSKTGEWMLHRDDDMPAQIALTGWPYTVQLAWYRNGLKHRADNKPSLVDSTLQVWCVENKLHRSDGGPSLIARDGSVDWHYEGELIRCVSSANTHQLLDNAYNCPFYLGREEMRVWQKNEANLVRWYNGPSQPPGGPSLA